MPTFSSILKWDRFSLLLRFLHLNDSSKYIPKGQAGHDPLYKLRPFIDPLLNNFRAAYNLGREISIDESMIGFKGRLYFIQYMPKKPTKWGMKAFVLDEVQHPLEAYHGLVNGNLPTKVVCSPEVVEQGVHKWPQLVQRVMPRLSLGNILGAVSEKEETK